MPRLDYKTCRHCGRPTSEVGPLSWTRQCERCAVARLTANNLELHDHRGPWFDHWRRSMALSVGAYLGEDVERALADGHE